MYGSLPNLTKQLSQLCPYHPEDGIRFHRLRAQSHKTTPTSDANGELRSSDQRTINWNSHNPLLGFDNLL